MNLPLTTAHDVPEMVQLILIVVWGYELVSS